MLKVNQNNTEELRKGKEKPEAGIIGANGNVFNLIAISRKALKKAGLPDEAEDLMNRVMQSGSYDEALQIIFEYIEPVEARG